MTTTTGTTLASYLDWLASEAGGKLFGEVGIYLTIHNGQIVDVRKTSVDLEHYRSIGTTPPIPVAVRTGKRGES